jgi:hypothetical protein
MVSGSRAGQGIGHRLRQRGALLGADRVLRHPSVRAQRTMFMRGRPTCATTPWEAVVATSELFVEYFMQSLTIPVWGTLLIGGALCGLVVEAAGRLWK